MTNDDPTNDDPTSDSSADPRLVRGESGPDLILSRSCAAGIDHVWATLTDPARTSAWYGPWRGDGSVGHAIQVQMRFEDGEPWLPMRIDACEPPTRLAVSMLEDQGDWRLEVLLAEAGDATRLSLIHHLTGLQGLGEIGPGWEYYLDLFSTALQPDGGAVTPVFTNYYPARAPVFTTLAEDYARHHEP